VSAHEPSEDEMQAALEEEMRRIPVEDILLQTTVTLINLAGRRLGLAPPGEAGGGDERDLGQARLGIEGARALAPLLAPEPAQAVKQALTQIQMAYARAAQEEGLAPPAAAPPGAPPAPAGPRPAPPAGPTEEEERAKARARIWTPGGGP